MSKGKMKRTAVLLLTVICLLFTVPVQGLAEPAAPETREDGSGEIRKQAELTVMVYMCGSDLESVHGRASEDIAEMLLSGYDTERVRVLIMTGGSRRWYIPENTAGQATIWELHPEMMDPSFRDLSPRQWEHYVPMFRQAMEPVLSGVSASMGVPSTLTEFLNYTYSNYPSDRYALILWDHGGGPNFGVCLDLIYDKDMMTPAELKNSLEASCFAKKPLEWIGFDACLMASAEVALQIAPCAGYMIASEESEPGQGWNYAFLSAVSPGQGGAETGKQIIDSYFDAFSGGSGSRSRTLTLSCIDLGKMNRVRDACEGMFADLYSGLTETGYAGIARGRRNSVRFGHAESESGKDMDLIDLGDFAKRTVTGDGSAKGALLDAIDEAVVYSRSSTEGACGLSAYFPYFNVDAFERFEQEYREISLSGSYYECISRFHGIQTGQARVSFAGLATHMPSLGKKDLRTLLSIGLTAEQMDALAEAALLVFEKDETGDAYALAAYVPEVRKQEESLSAEYVHRALFITDIDGNRISPVLPFTALADGMVTVETVLVRDDGEGKEVIRVPALLYLSMNDQNGAVTIENIYGYDECTGSYLPRYALEADDFDRAEFTRVLRIPKEYRDGTLYPWKEWEEERREVYTMSLRDERLRMMHNVLPWDSLHAGFLLEDYQNNHYISALLSLQESSESAQDALLVRYDDMETAAITGAQMKIRENGPKTKANLSMDITNLTDREIVFTAENLRINGEETTLAAEVYGTGKSGGLLPGETQTLLLFVPADVLSRWSAMTSVTFDLAAVEPESREEILRNLVEITMNQDLSFMQK